MDRKKQQKLEKAGWKVGTVQEFLDLSDEESQYIEIKLAFAHALFVRRISLKLSQEQLAKMLHSSQSRVAKMESGDSSVSLDLLIRSLLTIGITKKEIANTITSPKRKAA